MEFYKRSYETHKDVFLSFTKEQEKKKLACAWFDESTADSWRHLRMYAMLDCVSDIGETSWLTVGDGRWGLDSIRIAKKGARNVLPTDISEPLLKESKATGRIKDYSVENAECLSFSDNSFDYVFCKEALHHFPRPYVALYEMLRVARKAVFLVEPNDAQYGNHSLYYSTKLFKKTFKAFLKRTIFRKKDCIDTVHFNASSLSYSLASWEEGAKNYVYAVSRREMEKVALGLDCPHVVFKGINDHYVVGCEYEPADADKSKVFNEMLETISMLDAACRSGNIDYQVLMVGIYKTPLDTATREAYDRNGFEITDLPRNPYIA